MPRHPTVYLHVGAPKTGTTFLQGVLWSNRETLADRGVWLPGTRPNDHFRAGFDLRGLQQDPRDPREGWTGTWQAMATQIRQSASDIVVVSDERLAACSIEEVSRAVTSLAPADVHVIYTARDLVRLLPAEWQEHVKHRDSRTFDGWLADVIGNRREEWFWRVHDAADVLRRWGSALPPARLHVLTLPRSGSPADLLWERFASVLGVDSGGVDTNVRSNASLGADGAELLRRVNESLPPDFPRWHQVELTREILAHRILAPRPSKTPLTLPAEWVDRVRDHAERLIADLKNSGCHIAGDLNELMPDDHGADVAAPTQPCNVIDAAADGIAGLLTQMSTMRDERRRTAWRLAETQSERNSALARAAHAEATVREHRELPPVERIKRTVVELGGQWRLLGAGLDVWRRVKSRQRPGARRGHEEKQCSGDTPEEETRKG